MAIGVTKNIEQSIMKTKVNRFLAMTFASGLLISCAPLKAPTIIKNDALQGYKYVLVGSMEYMGCPAVKALIQGTTLLGYY